MQPALRFTEPCAHGRCDASCGWRRGRGAGFGRERAELVAGAGVLLAVARAFVLVTPAGPSARTAPVAGGAGSAPVWRRSVERVECRGWRGVAGAAARCFALPVATGVAAVAQRSWIARVRGAQCAGVVQDDLRAGGVRLAGARLSDVAPGSTRGAARDEPMSALPDDRSRTRGRLRSPDPSVL